MPRLVPIAILLLVYVLAAGCQQQASAPPALPSQVEDSHSTGIAADNAPTASTPGPEPVITLKVVDKEGFQQVLDSKRGQVVLVDFWATWCAPCMMAFPHTVALQQKYRPQGLAVISVSMDDVESHEEALNFLREQQADFTNLRSKLGGEDAAVEAFDIDGGAIPHLKLYDREGKLVKKFISGDIDAVFTQEDIELAVRELITKE
jgi:thiol-disulfide isomerase/thioredoxin